MNNDGWKEDSDPRCWRLYIDDRRRHINTPVMHIAVAVIPAPSVPTVVMSSHLFMVIFAEDRRHIDTADHCD